MKNNLWLSDSAPTSIEDEYGEELSHLPLNSGVAAALMVSLALFVIVLEFIVVTGANPDVMQGLFMQLFAQSATGISITALFIVSIIHLVTSAMFGLLFAYSMPYFPRAFWVVVGEIYGIFMGVLATIILAPIIQSVCPDGCPNRFMIMWINVLYGTFLGIAAATYGLKWSLPRWMHRHTQ